MPLNSIDIQANLAAIKSQLLKEPELSPALKALIEMLMIIVELLAHKLGLNSRNSSKPPSTDFPKTKNTDNKTSTKNQGKPRPKGSTLTQVDTPDEIEYLPLDRHKLPKGRYTEIGVEKRQVIDIEFHRVITEYQAQVLQDQNGKRFVADFPRGISKAIQYGQQLKAHAVYLSQYQLLPYQRIAEYFNEQLNIPISQGSIANFNQLAFDKLAAYEQYAKEQLRQATCVHADETGININGELHWLHCASNDKWTHFTAHKKRGLDAIEHAGILPQFEGVLVHDHWKPYYRLDQCTHALCNAHHLRELTRAYEQDQQSWAGRMKALLEIINRATHQAQGELSDKQQQTYRKYYHRLVRQGEQTCPGPPEKTPGRRGRVKRSKARNLLERLIHYEHDILRFMTDKAVPFTNNQSERDIRMTKVHQKISGCFRSQGGAHAFCRIRGYLSTCKKQNVPAAQALNLLFSGKLPDFCVVLD